MIDTCTHERVQVVMTGVSSFPVDREPDGLILITFQDLARFDIAQVETVCVACREKRVLTDDEWEVV